MSFTIKYLLLQKHELSYEVAIRGEFPSENVDGLRRQINKLTQLYPADEIIESVFDFNDDIKGCQESLDKVKKNLDALLLNYTESLFKRTDSLINHLHFRIQRIHPEKSDDISQLNNIKKMFDGFNTLFLELSKPGSSEPTPTSLLSDDAINKPNISGLNINVSCERSITSELAKLKYDGKSCVRAFIQKLEEFRVSKVISEDKMLLSATDIFIGDALHWFRSTKHKIFEWKNLIQCLRDDFDIPDYDYRMLSEIRNRTQGDGESITIYLSIMEGMFNRLSKPMSELDKLEIIVHNIRPCYSTLLAASSNITTLEQLRTTCKNYERFKILSDNFKEPPSLNSNLLAPEFCYQRKQLNIHTINIKNVDEPIKKSVFCFRCRVNTHTLRDCKAERKILCFGCGQEGIRKPECPKCSRSKN